MKLPTSDIQSLVFTGHGRLPHALAVGMAVRDRTQARVGLRRLLGGAISFGLSQGVRTQGLQLLLSAAGVRALDGHDSGLIGFSGAFNEGIATPQRSRALGDSEKNRPDAWGWRDDRVHALLLVYGKDEGAVQSERDRLFGLLGAGWEPAGVQLRICLPEDSREPFGFRDGISTPRIDVGSGERNADAEVIPAGEVLLGQPTAAGVVTPPPALGEGGAYVVVRQLEQDVEGFWRFWRAQSRSEAEAIWLASKALGRWPNGMPMRSLGPEPEPAAVEAEVMGALSFAGDPDGLQCPIGAHIRRANPRDTLVEDPEQSIRVVGHHRLLRRGRTYGSPAPAEWYPAILSRPKLGSGAGEGVGERGLLFVCVCADVERQFEFVQQTWMNNPKFGDLRDEVDAIAAGVAIPGAGDRISIPACPVRRRVSGLRSWVTVRGGGYFLLPGKRALERWLDA